MGFGSFGPISKTSLPLYGGRFYDDVSKRTRTIQKPKKKLMNPYNWNSTVGYLEANIIYAWNRYVNAT